MTVAELKAYADGASDDGVGRHYETRGDIHITGWTGPMCGEDGWWWAMTRKAGDHEIVVAMGWCAGGIRKRDLEIARRLTAGAEGLPS